MSKRFLFRLALLTVLGSASVLAFSVPSFRDGQASSAGRGSHYRQQDGQQDTKQVHHNLLFKQRETVCPEGRKAIPHHPGGTAQPGPWTDTCKTWAGHNAK